MNLLSGVSNDRQNILNCDRNGVEHRCEIRAADGFVDGKHFVTVEVLSVRGDAPIDLHVRGFAIDPASGQPISPSRSYIVPTHWMRLSAPPLREGARVGDLAAPRGTSTRSNCSGPRLAGCGRYSLHAARGKSICWSKRWPVACFSDANRLLRACGKGRTELSVATPDGQLLQTCERIDDSKRASRACLIDRQTYDNADLRRLVVTLRGGTVFSGVRLDMKALALYPETVA